MSHSYYGEHAYRSSQPRQQPRQQKGPTGAGYARLPWGNTQDRLPFAMVDRMQSLILEEDKRVAPYQPNIPPEHWSIYNHQYLQNTDYAKWSVWLNILLGAGKMLAIPATLIVLVTFLISYYNLGEGVSKEKWIEAYITVSFFIPGICWYAWLAGIIILKFCPDILRKKGDGKIKWRFNRQTGLVSHFIYNKEKPDAPPLEQTAPFDEFDGYILTSMTRHGFLNEFILYHRYQGWTFNTSELTGSKIDRWTVTNGWEFIQNFMDTSKPLPEHPSLEIYRHLDPVTAEYDKKIGRNPRKLRDLSKQDYEKYTEQIGLMLYPEIENRDCLFEQGGYVEYLPKWNWDAAKIVDDTRPANTDND